jgi:diaminohydroxyphosphoribosylaminopyrimidine deaminase / 5-amino-6-(5-phosphoribosylamino)uracil reductase
MPLVRVVLDTWLRIPHESKLVQTARDWPLIIFTGHEEEVHLSGRSVESWKARLALLERSGAQVVSVNSIDGRLDLHEVLTEIGRRQLISLIVEGGSEVAGTFVERGLIDKATFFIAPRIIGGRDAIAGIGGHGFEDLSDALELQEVEVIQRGDDCSHHEYKKR